MKAGTRVVTVGEGHFRGIVRQVFPKWFDCEAHIQELGGLNRTTHQCTRGMKQYLKWERLADTVEAYTAEDNKELFDEQWYEILLFGQTGDWSVAVTWMPASYLKIEE